MRTLISTTPPAAHAISRWYQAALATAALLAVATTALNGMAAHRWTGESFPGFFVLANRVIAPVGGSDWSGQRDGSVYQWTVTAVDGRRVATGSDVYRHVAGQAPGQRIAYTLRRGSATRTLTLPSQRFSSADYAALFGPYLVSGFLYLLVGLLAAALVCHTRVGGALLAVGTLAGIDALSSVALYEPVSTMRLHALSEAFLPAAFVYLALVFPRERGWVTRSLAAAAWSLSLAIALPYQLLLDQPAAYTVLHTACEIYGGIAGVALLVSLVIEHGRAGDGASPLLRCAVGGALLGLGAPAITMMLSAVSGGALPVNAASAIAFVFPACLVFGLLRDRVAVASRSATTIPA